MLLSPYLRTVTDALTQWRALRAALAQTETEEDVEVEEARFDAQLALTVEECTPTSVAVSWGGWEYPAVAQSSPAADPACLADEAARRKKMPRDYFEESEGRLALQARARGGQSPASTH